MSTLIKKIIRGVVNGTEISLADVGVNGTIEALYTILDENLLFSRFQPETGERYDVDLQEANVIHGMSVFADDVGHDWRVVKSGKVLRLNTHSSKVGSTIDIMIEYKPTERESIHE